MITYSILMINYSIWKKIKSNNICTTFENLVKKYFKIDIESTWYFDSTSFVLNFFKNNI